MLARRAQALRRTARLQNAPGLPSMLVLTDPQRTPDPLALAERLPSGVGLVYRTFGAADALQIAGRLAHMARSRGWTLLISADADLALACGAQGVHLPERLVHRAPRLRARWPGRLITGAAHDASALRRAARAKLDAALLSAVFPSLSPSAGPPIGPVRLSSLVRGASLPVYALGGVDGDTAPRLRGTGVAGLAAVGAAASALRPR